MKQKSSSSSSHSSLHPWSLLRLVQEVVAARTGVCHSGGRHCSRRCPMQRCRHRQPLTPFFQRPIIHTPRLYQGGKRDHRDEDGTTTTMVSTEPRLPYRPPLKLMYLVFCSLLVHEGVNDHAPPPARGLCRRGGRGHTEKGLGTQEEAAEHAKKMDGERGSDSISSERVFRIGETLNLVRLLHIV